MSALCGQSQEFSLRLDFQLRDRLFSEVAFAYLGNVVIGLPLC